MQIDTKGVEASEKRPVENQQVFIEVYEKISHIFKQGKPLEEGPGGGG